MSGQQVEVCGTRRTRRLIRALAAERHEDWLEGNRYLNMGLLAEQNRELLREAT